MDGKSSVSAFDWRSTAMERRVRFALAQGHCDKLLHKLVELGEQSLQYYLGLLEVFEEKISACERLETVGEGQMRADVVDRENPETDASLQGPELSDFEDELPTANDSFQLVTNDPCSLVIH